MPKIVKLGAPQHRRRFGPGRSFLRQAVRERGRRAHNLWYHYSPRLQRDVILKSDVEFAHFCWVEADPQVSRYQLEPPAVTVVVGTEAVRTRFDAFVEFRAAPPELREIKVAEESLSESEVKQKAAQVQAATDAGFRYVRITKQDLAPHALLIRNWRCALAHQAACRGLLLAPFEEEILAAARLSKNSSLEELLRKTNPDLRGRFLAALFGLLQTARVHSDISTKPLCAATRLWLPEVGHV